MDKIESLDYVILLISEAYLRSYNCLYEAIAAYKGKSKQNLIPVVFNNAHIFDYNKQIDLISFWNESKTKLAANSECLNSISKIEISKRLRQMDVISNYLGDFLAFISDINCILSDADEDSLASIHTCLCDKILAQEIRYNTVPINRSIILPNKNLLCIDFGTSYTLASVVDIYGNKHLIPNINGQTIIRSTIELNDDGKYFIGGSDINAIKNIKRFIGAKEYIKYGKRKFDIRILIFGIAIRNFFAPNYKETVAYSIMIPPYFVGVGHITINFETTITSLIRYQMCSTTLVVPHLVDVKCDPLMVTIVPNLATFAN